MLVFGAMDFPVLDNTKPFTKSLNGFGGVVFSDIPET